MEFYGPSDAPFLEINGLSIGWRREWLTLLCQHTSDEYESIYRQSISEHLKDEHKLIMDNIDWREFTVAIDNYRILVKGEIDEE